MDVDAQQRRRFRIEGDGVDRAALARAVEQGVEDHNDGQRRHDYQQFLNEHAEQVYRTLSPEQKTAAEKLFRCITEMTDEGNLVRRAGVMGIVLAGGEVRPGDGIEVAEPAGPHRPLRPV